MPIKTAESTVQFKKGDVLFHEGTSGDYFFVIQKGLVEITKKGQNGDQIPLATLGAGQCVGEFSVLDGRPRSATVTALSDLSAVKISSAAMELQIKKLPSWFVTITRNLVSRIREIDNILKRNNIVDEQLAGIIRAIEYNADKPKMPINPPIAGEPEEPGEPEEEGADFEMDIKGFRQS